MCFILCVYDLCMYVCMLCLCWILYYLKKIYINAIKARGGSSYDNRLRTATEQNVFTNIQFISKKGKLKKWFRHATSYVCACTEFVNESESLSFFSFRKVFQYDCVCLWIRTTRRVSCVSHVDGQRILFFRFWNVIKIKCELISIKYLEI